MHIECPPWCYLDPLSLDNQTATRNTHIAMFDGIDADAIEVRPGIPFTPRESIAVLTPDLPARHAIQLVQSYGAFAVQALDKLVDRRDLAGVEEQVVVISQNHPGVQPDAILRDCVPEYIL